MPIRYRYQNAKNYVLAEVIGTVTLEEAVAYTKTLENDSSISKPFYEIVNFADTGRFDIDYHDAHEIVLRFKALHESKGYLGSLLIAPTLLSTGMSNVFNVVGETHGLTVKVFKTIAEAEDYIVAHYP